MSSNKNSKCYKAYLLLNERVLEYEELKTIFKEESPTKLLFIVCSSIHVYFDELKENYDLLNNKYLNNLKITIIKMLSFCKHGNIGESLNDLKKLERKCLKFDGGIKEKLKSYIYELQEFLIHRLNDNCEYSNYEFLNCIIYEIKSISYLKQILNTYPHYINTRNHNNKHIVLELIDKLLILLDEPDNRDVTYYNSVILEFLNRTRFHVSNNEIKQYCLKIDILLRGLKRNDENYKIKMSFYKSILNNLLNKEITTENIELINNKFGVTQGFNPIIQDELKKIKEKDFIITIDSEDTLDMDDAMSIKFLGEYYHLKVYIADVANVIKPNSKIDEEALRRIETLYLSDLTIPMLPTELSNDLLSLNSRAYKGVICFECDIYKDGSIANFKISKDRILINKNFTYEQVDNILKFGDMDFKTCETLNNLSDAANILKSQNQTKIVYRLVEEHVNQGKKIDKQKNIYDERTSAEIIIEEFMILINVMTAQLFMDLGYPFIYRVHPNSYLKNDYNSLVNLKELLESTQVDKDKNIKLINCLINMYSEAYYSLNNIGHFGLDKEAYCHATSPIRRYPDIIVQRLINDYIFSKPTKQKDIFWETKIKELCTYCNERMKQNRLYQNEYEQTKTLIKKLSC